jgi:serine/threonine-protein kinase haspin
MAPQKQKRYGNRPRQDALFRLSPFLTNSPVKKQESNVDDLAHQLSKVQIQQDTPKRKVLGQITLNAQSSAQNTRSKGKAAVSSPCGVDDLARAVSQLAINPSQSKSKPPDVLREWASPLLSLASDPFAGPTPFSAWSSTLEPYFNIVKIAEASYGEVYRLVLKASHPQFRKSDESVLKILALKPPPSAKKKSKSQAEKESFMSAVDNVAAEVKLLQRMADIPGFTHFRDIRVLRGKPSPVFAQAWRQFNDDKPDDDKSQFPDPSKRGSYNEQQLWAVIEMQDAGTDLEHVQLHNVFAVWDVFWGVTIALAKGEQEAEFEHRDLHMGNICVKSRKEDEDVGAENARIRVEKHQRLGFTGLETTIIDYTLSRAVTRLTEDGEAEVEFLDLATDEALFEGDGEYQYDMYRCMRSAKEESWADFNPVTNIIWLHFILHEMLASPWFAWPSSRKKRIPASRAGPSIHTASSTARRITSPRTKQIPRRVSDDKLEKIKAKELEVALKKMKKLLDLEHLADLEVESATSLVCLALEQGWLDDGDVVGEGDTSLASDASV